MTEWGMWLGFASLAGLALFSALNLALRMPSRTRIAEQFQLAGREAVFEQIVERRPRYMLATAILRSAFVFTLFLSSGLLAYSRSALHTPAQIAITCACAWLLLLVFGIAVPYAWAKYRSDWLLLRFLPLLRISIWVCLPIMLFCGLFDPLVRRLSGVGPQGAQSYADAFEREILDVVTEGELHGAVDEQEKEMIESVMGLGDTRVAEIMTPRTEIVALGVDADLDTIRDTIRKHGHSRIPVYDGTIDTILGVLYVKDLLRRGEPENLNLRSFIRKAFFIPESKPVPDLLREFQTQKVHMAIVLDEYGGTAGLVSIEDILEELVGELADEYEATEPAPVKALDDSTYEVDARIRIAELNDQLHVDLPESQDYETIGGFVFAKLGRIPRAGEQCEHQNVHIEVIGAEPRRITRLLLKVTEGQETREPEHSAV